MQRDSRLSREALNVSAELRPPVLERDYRGAFLANHLGVAVRHTIAPELHYTYVAGINNFNNVERFDALDVFSDTNEIEYGMMQRWFVKPLRSHPCTVDELASELQQSSVGQRKENPPVPKTCVGQTREWLSWYVAQKRFFDPTFGGAVVPGHRNIFTSTLDFSAITYVTSPRNLSPTLSRLRLRTSGTTDVEWDLDYDTKAGRVAASNVFANYRYNNFFSSFGSALMNAPAENIVASGKPVSVTNYNQIQMLLGYGAATKPGLSAAANGGLDVNLHSLEYAGAQTSYNFDCCGFSVEYRRFALGSVRNENQYSFSFTLAGVGAAGNLKRAERLF